MINEVLGKLGVQEYEIKMNHRQILNGIAEAVGEMDKFADLCVAIDKLDKIGLEKVLEELKGRGFQDTAIQALQPVFALAEAGKTNEEKIAFFENLFQNSDNGKKGVEDLKQVFELLRTFSNAKDFPINLHIDFDATLARGLSYYTGAIFEVKVKGVQVGSISGGGRYDNLTGAFGVPDISGVGFSFGVDRLYDVLEELQLFPAEATVATQILMIGFDEATYNYCLPTLYELRQAGFATELYPTIEKQLKKPMKYANARHIPYTILAGSEEMEAGEFSVKDMISGEQKRVKASALISFFSAL
jgi:histidyl-tRNA synthetase